LNALFYGVYEDEYKAVAIDENGLFLFSPQSVITVTATNLDIRDLNFNTDSVTVTASNFNIRNLTGATDSIAISSVGFVEQTVTQTVSSGTTPLLTQDISAYGQNSFFVRNNSGGSITVSVQISPLNTNNFFINSSTPTTVGVGNNFAAGITIPAKFARIQVQAANNTGVTVYYNGRA